MCDIANAFMSEADGKQVVLSPAGETWIDIGAERVGNNLTLGLLTFLRNGKWGLVDTTGQIMVEPQYDEPVYFLPALRGVAWAKRGERWCAIDRRGTPVPSLPCADADPTGSRLVPVQGRALNFGVRCWHAPCPCQPLRIRAVPDHERYRNRGAHPVSWTE
jgi:hypothetical protein